MSDNLRIPRAHVDTNPQETREWLDSLEYVLQANGSGRASAVTRFPWVASGYATTLGRNEGPMKLVLDAESGRILGIGLCGVGAGELISEDVLAVEMGAVAEDAAASINPHPTLSETVMEAAGLFYGQAIHLYESKR